MSPTAVWVLRFFWCKSIFSRFLCLSWWPAGLTSCLPPSSNLVRHGRRERENVVVGSSGGVFYSGDGLTGEGGDLAPTLEEVIEKLSWTQLITSSLGFLGHSFIHEHKILDWCASSGGKETAKDVLTELTVGPLESSAWCRWSKAEALFYAPVLPVRTHDFSDPTSLYSETHSRFETNVKRTASNIFLRKHPQ